MERPDNVPEAVWKSHLDWFDVTGETSHRHIRELRRGKLGTRYQSHESENDGLDNEFNGNAPVPSQPSVEGT